MQHSIPNRLAFPFRRVALASVLTLASLASTATAQTFTIFGEVRPTPTGYHLADVDIPLTGKFDFQQFVGKVVEVRGTNQGTTKEPTIEVGSIQEAQDVLRADHEVRLGRELRMRIDSRTGQRWLFFLSPGRGFLPLDDLFPGVALKGTFFLDVATYYVFGPGALSGNHEERVPIPAAKELIGVRFWTQAATVLPDKTGVYTNAVSVTIRR